MQTIGAIARRQRLLDVIRRDGGQWDWVRARGTYEEYPDPRTVRRDLQELARAGGLIRVEKGLYEASAPLAPREPAGPDGPAAE